MTDADIVTLYWARDEQAIAQTAQKFGAYCRKIAMNLLGSQEDAEECENDTWMAAWNSMPQNRPDKLAPYLGRITATWHWTCWSGKMPKSAAAARPKPCWKSWNFACPPETTPRRR